MEAPLNSISLFSGCFGFDLGLEQAGISTLAGVELDSVCRQTILSNRKLPLAIDVFQAKGKDLLALSGRDKVDLVVGSPPCQSFSTIGKRAQTGDIRGLAVLEFVRLVGEICPTVFIMENVRGLWSAKHEGRLVTEFLTEQFQKFGYIVDWWQLDAADYQAPQHRVRVFGVGSLKGKINPPNPILPHIPLRCAIADLELFPGEGVQFSKKMTEVMKLIPPGGNWRSLPKDIQDSAMGGANRKSGGLTAFYRRLHYDFPSATLVTTPTQRATTLCHPVETRPLSIAEYKRIQCFPDNWEFCGSITQKYRQIGNAVPVTLGKAIGKVIVEHMRL